MPNNELSRLFDRLESMGVGFGPLFRDFQNYTATYPPHNIIKISDTEFLIEMAVAGFKKEEISIEECQGLLTVKGDKNLNTDSSKSTDVVNSQYYQHRGIANRSFSKSFRIAEYFEVSEAKLEDGILSVTFVKNVPEEAKPKLIAIR